MAWEESAQVVVVSGFGEGKECCYYWDLRLRGVIEEREWDLVQAGFSLSEWFLSSAIRCSEQVN